MPKQLPPQPTPGFRNRAPMRESRPMPAITSVASAPTRSQILAISLAKPIFIARNALAAYLIISALVSVVVTTGARASGRPRQERGRVERCSTSGSYNSRRLQLRIVFRAKHDAVRIERIGDGAALAQKLRIAGDAEADALGVAWMLLRRMPSRTSVSTRLPLPTGTVDLFTTTRNSGIVHGRADAARGRLQIAKIGFAAWAAAACPPR